MLDRIFILVWCGVVCTIVPISAGCALFLIAKNWDMTCIKNREPTAHSCWIITIAVQTLLWTVILLMVELNLVELSTMFNLMVATSVLNYVNWAFFIHRIWMLFYKSLLQKSFADFNISDTEELRAGKWISNLLSTQRHRLGDSMFMSVVWLINCCAFSGLLTYLSLNCGVECVEAHYYPPYDILNDLLAGSLTIFGLSMLIAQKRFTVSDSFSIATELIWKCIVIGTFFPVFGLILHTDVLIHEDEIWDLTDKLNYALLVITLMLLIQLLIANYYIWEIISRLKNERLKQCSRINLEEVFRNEELFLEFKKHLKQEFSIENLNFLVSCIQYRRMVMLQGDFGVESSSSSTDSDTENARLNWRESFTLETLGNRESDPVKMAQDIFNEYCIRGAPQEICLTKPIAENLSKEIEKLESIYRYPRGDIFREACREVEKLLSEDALKRFKCCHATRCVDNKYRCRIDGDYGEPLLPCTAGRAKLSDTCS